MAGDKPGPAPYTVHRGVMIDSVAEQYRVAEERARELAATHPDVFVTNGINEKIWP